MIIYTLNIVRKCDAIVKLCVKQYVICFEFILLVYCFGDSDRLSCCHSVRLYFYGFVQHVEACWLRTVERFPVSFSLLE